MATSEPSCTTCAFFVRHDKAVRGNCRRYPEVAHKVGTEWCGEYQKRPRTGGRGKT